MNVVHFRRFVMNRASRDFFGGWYSVPLTLVALVLGCAGGPSADDLEVGSLTLERLDSLILDIPEGVVQRITEFARQDRGYVVLDGGGQKVHLFDFQGKHALSFGGPGDGPGEFRDPMGLAVDGERILVVDPARGRALITYGWDRELIAEEQLRLSHDPLDVQAEAGLTYVLAYPATNPAQEAQEGRDRVWVLGSGGDVIGHGCPADPRYIESSGQDGRIGRMLGGSLALEADRLYCIQGISPTVQVMGLDGVEVGTITIRPPFYQDPVDGPFTTDRKQTLQFLSEWTAHRGVYPLREGAGFVSVYSQYDQSIEDFRYWLFRCAIEQEVQVSRCATAEVAQKPILVTPDGTVFLEEELSAGGAPVVGIYRIAERH